MGWIPAPARAETDIVSFIPTAGMIPPDQAGPAVGIAGTTAGLWASQNRLVIAYAAPEAQAAPASEGLGWTALFLLAAC